MKKKIQITRCCGKEPEIRDSSCCEFDDWNAECQTCGRAVSGYDSFVDAVSAWNETFKPVKKVVQILTVKIFDQSGTVLFSEVIPEEGVVEIRKGDETLIRSISFGKWAK